MFRRTILNTWVQILAKIITILISLVTTGLLTRKLGASVYGSYTLVVSVFLLLDSISDFGTKVIGVKEASQIEKEERNKLFVQVAWTRLLTTLFAFCLGIILIFTWNGFAMIKTEAFIALTMIWFTSIAGSLEIIFQIIVFNNSFVLEYPNYFNVGVWSLFNSQNLKFNDRVESFKESFKIV